MIARDNPSPRSFAFRCGRRQCHNGTGANHPSMMLEPFPEGNGGLSVAFCSGQSPSDGTGRYDGLCTKNPIQTNFRNILHGKSGGLYTDIPTTL